MATTDLTLEDAEGEQYTAIEGKKRKHDANCRMLNSMPDPYKFK